MNRFLELYQKIVEEAEKKKSHIPTESELNALAKRAFPYEDECSIATAWVLTDGSCLDFSGWYSRGRALDHREINTIFMGLDFTPEYNEMNKGSSSGYMLAFMDLARAIRVGLNVHSGFVSLTHPANRIQANKIFDYFVDAENKYGEVEILIDVYDNMYTLLDEKVLYSTDYLKEILMRI